MVNMSIASKRKNNFKVHRPYRELTRREEVIHAVTHGLGALVSILALVLLVIRASGQGALAVAGAAVFGSSLIILYSASCLYHSSCIKYRTLEAGALRRVCQKIDHSMIFILIVGTYVPACWTALGGWIGWTVFGIVGTCSVVGFVLNWISVKRFEKIVLTLNIISGWTIVVAGVPYFNAIGEIGFNYLVAGGLFYTIGIIFYKMQRIPYMHVIWHLFVIAGSLMHYIMIYNFVY